MTKDSLAITIEALSWMAYAGMGERTALLKAADEVKVTDSSELRQAHRVVMGSHPLPKQVRLLDRPSHTCGEAE